MAIADRPIPFEDFPAHLMRMGAALENHDWSDLWREELRPIVLEGQESNFDNATDAEGNPWPLRTYHNHPRLDRGRSGIPGHPLLEDLNLITGDELKASVINPSATEHVERIGKDEFETGTSVYYAADHEYGSPEKNLPARSFIGIREEFIDRLEESVANAALELLSGV